MKTKQPEQIDCSGFRFITANNNPNLSPAGFHPAWRGNHSKLNSGVTEFVQPPPQAKVTELVQLPPQANEAEFVQPTKVNDTLLVQFPPQANEVVFVQLPPQANAHAFVSPPHASTAEFVQPPPQAMEAGLAVDVAGL